jgi:adenine/guanine/hypoxanthine permease
MPDDIVFGRILPATGLMLFLSTMYYAWLAYDLARKTGRNDVCALPSGISVPHMFVVTFVIMLPIALQTGDPIKGWEAGLTWVFIQSFVLMAAGSSRRSSARSRRAPRCSARSPACRSPSSRCGPRSRCS